MSNQREEKPQEKPRENDRPKIPQIPREDLTYHERDYKPTIQKK